MAIPQKDIPLLRTMMLTVETAIRCKSDKVGQSKTRERNRQMRGERDRKTNIETLYNMHESARGRKKRKPAEQLKKAVKSEATSN